jgi:hypothetical protein
VVQNKKIRGAKCRKHMIIGENFKIPGGAPAPPHIHTALPLISRLPGYACGENLVGRREPSYMSHKSPEKD